MDSAGEHPGPVAAGHQGVEAAVEAVEAALEGVGAALEGVGAVAAVEAVAARHS